MELVKKRSSCFVTELKKSVEAQHILMQVTLMLPLPKIVAARLGY